MVVWAWLNVAALARMAAAINLRFMSFIVFLRCKSNWKCVFSWWYPLSSQAGCANFICVYFLRFRSVKINLGQPKQKRKFNIIQPFVNEIKKASS
jgi:hypothetical protein